jgi:hypothetical protein
MLIMFRGYTVYMRGTDAKVSKAHAASIFGFEVCQIGLGSVYIRTCLKIGIGQYCTPLRYLSSQNACCPTLRDIFDHQIPIWNNEIKMYKTADLKSGVTVECRNGGQLGRDSKYCIGMKLRLQHW